MLSIRIEGDQAEADAFVAALRAGGAEVQVGTRKNRGGFWHVYAMVRMPDHQPGAATEPAATAPPARGLRPSRPRARRA